jgi:hypothetical protein
MMMDESMIILLFSFLLFFNNGRAIDMELVDFPII